ncbi:DNA topoisomerase I [Candidatus Woesearchaeota archaeon]|nr:DNA topoisomerase I [Candidatus Woesearchaeota archaeon]
MYTLVVSEKPAAAKKIAEALADGKPVKGTINKVAYYKITKDDKDIVVGCSAGHLYGLAQKKKGGMQYPVFDIQWTELKDVSKKSAFSDKYLKVLKKLAKDADDVVVGTDLDTEGEVIGLNIVRYVCKRKDAKRMRFSTLTTDDLRKAYAEASPTLDWGLALAGETRHFLDYYYGINMSRALTTAIKKAGMFKILSAGRVQGPALKILVDREKSIQDFTATPFWKVELVTKEFSAWHQADKIWKEKEAKEILANTKGQKKAIVDKTAQRQYTQQPPHPFDLTTLQTESYRCFGINPKATLSIAQDLYTSGYISYPRTSSQQLPVAIGYASIKKKLEKKYGDLVKLTGPTPHNGKKTDPAHPAIYPTGSIPRALDGRNLKVYDLIVKRFLASFGKIAKRETVTLTLNVNQELFIAKGTRTIEKGWHDIYAPYVKQEEVELPSLKEKDEVKIKKITKHDLETAPPKRYTPSSIIKELEKRNLGTKATRADIVDRLVMRSYVKGEHLEATELGVHVCDVLDKYCPKMVDEDLTRHFEEEMEQIREEKKKEEDVLEEAQGALTQLLKEFGKKEADIGEQLKQTFANTRDEMNTLGDCPKCDGVLMIRKGKFGRFAACNKYPECETTSKLPANGLIQSLEKACEACKYPFVKVIKKRKRPQELCMNSECPTKGADVEVKGKCPKCKEGNQILRKSMYGAFIACDRFPKCFHTAKLPE